MATLRHLGPIDRALAARLAREPPEPVRMILRLGAAQLFWLDTPAYAAVDSSVALAEAGGATRGFKPLVNAVLRRLGREGKPVEDPADARRRRGSSRAGGRPTARRTPPRSPR